ncbi:hypothetical protein BHE74_00038426 [Ensete ventricosum]|nr:hypothetical protein GW17_00033753 [Ensete ventricosum]RWW54966.1 hypothetical protein BHE74_00038426 [Ensete ventricosum]RZR98000.1 hypothetical protein BHM03_00027287 [Ensete ventricosum]
MGPKMDPAKSSMWPAKERPNKLSGPLLPGLGLALFLGFATTGADGFGDRRRRRCDHSTPVPCSVSLSSALDLPSFFGSINCQRFTLSHKH